MGGSSFRPCRLLGLGFFGNAIFGRCFSRANFALCFNNRFNGFGFTRCFCFDHFHSGFGFHDFSFDGRFARIGDAGEEDCSGSASKQFGHLEFPLNFLDTLPGGEFPRDPALLPIDQGQIAAKTRQICSK